MTAPLFRKSLAIDEKQPNSSVAKTLHDNHRLYQDASVLNPECAEFMLGGTEAITYDLIHDFHGLLCHDEKAEKLRRELDLLADNDNIWEDTRVPSLPYLVSVPYTIMLDGVGDTY